MAIRKGIYVKLCLQWERNEYFIPREKKKRQLKWAILRHLLSPLASGFNADASGPGHTLQGVGEEEP